MHEYIRSPSFVDDQPFKFRGSTEAFHVFKSVKELFYNGNYSARS